MPDAAPEMWLASADQRSAWDTLLAGSWIAEAAAAGASLASAVQGAEAGALPGLCDARCFLRCVYDLRTVRHGAGRRLLIDCSTAGVELTTRVTQAVGFCKSIVIALRRVRSALVRRLLALVVDTLSAEEWAWMGTYAAWRRGDQVFIYPENFLLPSLRAWVSPVLSSIFDQTAAALTSTRDPGSSSSRRVTSRTCASSHAAARRPRCTPTPGADCWRSGKVRPLAPHLSFRCQREPVRVLGGV